MLSNLYCLTQAVAGIEAKWYAQLNISECIFIPSSGYGISATHDTDANAKALSITSNVFVGGSGGISVTCKPPSSSILIANNTISAINNIGINLLLTGTGANVTKNVTISGNLLYLNTGAGIGISGGPLMGLGIVGNTLFENVVGGSAYQIDVAGLDAANPVSYGCVTGNTFQKGTTGNATGNVRLGETGATSSCTKFAVTGNAGDQATNVIDPIHHVLGVNIWG